MRHVYVVDGLRTPFLKARGTANPFSAADLAVAAGRALLSRQSFSATDIDEVIMGCVMPRENEANIGRIIGLRLGCGEKTPGWTVQRNCASGMQALDCAAQDISSGRADLVLAGGTESMSRAPLMLTQDLTNWLAKWSSSKTFLARLKTLLQLRPQYFVPIVALLHGLSDPFCGLNMGQTAEILAYQFDITRQEMDAFSLLSHQWLAKAYDEKHLTEVISLYDNLGRCYEEDEGLRRDTTMVALAKLKPFFDKKFGLVTAGNSSQISDGASLLILASEKAVRQYSLPVLGRIVDTHWAALSPQVMGLGPAMAAPPLLARHQLSLKDIDYWEINEAFAGQVLACLKAWESPVFCHEHLGLSQAFGTLDRNRLNVDGGAIALGHPVGASGARIVLHLLNVLKRERATRGVAAICIGGGQGGAMLLETDV